jgi:hypothetical protein
MRYGAIRDARIPGATPGWRPQATIEQVFELAEQDPLLALRRNRRQSCEGG